jgi:hypothetical protein
LERAHPVREAVYIEGGEEEKHKKEKREIEEKVKNKL